MARSIAILLFSATLLTGCLSRRTEAVPDPNASGRDSAANGGMDAAGNGGDGSQPDGMVVIACDDDKTCTRADLSRCDETTDSCAPCKVSRDCSAIAGKSACVKDVGCFECSDDNNTCKAPSALCHPTRRECVACTAANTTACDANGKVCEPQSGACVGCINNTQCTDVNKAKCEGGKNECGKCTANADCAHLTATPYCDATAGKCVACTANSQCTDPKASRCDLTMNTCVGCGGVNDCIGIVDAASKEALPLCVSQECVQCTRADRNQCAGNVCNALTKRCEDGVTPMSADECGGCVSDDQCKDGRVCVMTKFNGADAGYYCQRPKGTNCAAQRPFFLPADAVTSIDGTASVNVCTLSESTCPSRNDYRNKDCGVDTDGDNLDDKGDNSVCGDPNFADDGYCVNFDNGVFRCTMACAALEDCPTDFAGSTCSTLSHGSEVPQASRKLCTIKP